MNKAIKSLCIIVLMSMLMMFVFCVPGAMAYSHDRTVSVKNSFVTELDIDDEILNVNIGLLKKMEILGDLSTSPAGFEFIMTSYDGKYTGEIANAISNKEGSASFTVSFPTNAILENINESYIFSVVEKNTGRPGVEYDDAVYYVRISFTSGEDMPVQAQVEFALENSSADEIVFINSYEAYPPVAPPTGDGDCPALYAALMAAAAMGCVLMMRRREEA